MNRRVKVNSNDCLSRDNIIILCVLISDRDNYLLTIAIWKGSSGLSTIDRHKLRKKSERNQL